MCENRAQACKEPAKSDWALLLHHRFTKAILVSSWTDTDLLVLQLNIFFWKLVKGDLNMMLVQMHNYFWMGILICTFSSFSYHNYSHQIIPVFWTSLTLIPFTVHKATHRVRVMRGSSVSQLIDVKALQPFTSDKGWRDICAICPRLGCFFLRKHATLSTIQPSPCGNISNECFSGPSGLGVLAELNASGPCGCPRAKHGSFGWVMLCGAKDKSGWSGMVIKCKRASLRAEALWQ